MVHRAPDSRLLTNLIASEKDYSKHLTALFPIAQSALASLSAYASASPSSPARTIATVVDLLASADDALQRYNDAIESWRNQLTSLKSLEDDLSAVLRDRDILITRLIKVSKTTREAHRSSRIVAPLTGLGSASLASLASLASTNSTTATHTASGSNPSITNSKLAQAQAELQACEAHLVAKERELDARRTSVARDGLGARCRALIDCGWVWGEMGKQGLKTLQALSVNGVAQNSVPLNPTYGSDNSSVTPSQSASQTAAQSAVISHENPTTSKELRRTTSEPEATSTTRTTPTQAHSNVTITLPPPHAISELTLPTVVRSPLPLNGDPAQKHNGINAKPAITPASRRKRMKRPRRPPSQHIAEVSGEDSDGHRNSVDASAKPTARTPFPTALSQDTSSEEEQSVGPFKIVENDPFEMIRKSIIAPSPSVPHLPTIPTVPPNGRVSAETSPSKTAVSTVDAPSLGRGTASTHKRERRTSMAFFGSLRGLFRKPKDKEKAETEWDEGYSSPMPNGNVRGPAPVWVTRTDARIKGKSKEADSDQDATPVVNAGRGKLGTRLRKGRPRGMDESGPLPQDGWATDSHGVGASMTALDRSGTHRGTVKPKKLSVADLRGSEQGHTDGEVDGRVPGKARAVEEHGNRRESISRGVPRDKGRRVEEEQKRVLAHRESVSKNVIVDLDVEHRRTATTSPTLNRTTSVTHRRSASLTVVDAHAVTSSSTGSWQKPAVESAPRPASPSRTASTKPQVKRQFGNGHATHAKNQSLMSIVADVTGQVPSEEERARSLDIPRAPGSVLKETAEVGRRASLAMGDDAAQGQGPGRGQAQGQGQGRGVVKMPLRSALRNASRTPSPSPGPVIVDAKKKGEEERNLLRDSMSISSYETGRESLNGEEDGEEMPPPFTFPPPPVDPPPTVARRKSVRVSLQPTFSPSPPASPALQLCDDDDEVEVGRSRSEDMWADSASEEEVYTRARGLLMVQGKDKGKGKARR